MSGSEERSPGEDVATPAEGDGQARIADHVAARNADDPDVLDDVPREDVPAGGAGADSGAAAAVQVDPDDESSVKNLSSHNDEPGVGTRTSGE